MITLPHVTNHIRNRAYMSGVERDKLRIKQTEEVFTPDWLVDEIIDMLVADRPGLFHNRESTFLDPCCGDGQFLGEVLIRKMQAGSDFETALLSIRGVDIMNDNVELCRERLLCGQLQLSYIVEQNIVCADSLRYHYRFDGSDPYDPESGAVNEDIFNDLFGN